VGLTLERGDLVVDLAADPFAHLDDGNGWGLAPVSLQWADGAGDGSNLRGGRALRRPMTVPLLVRGANRLEVDDRINLIGQILDVGVYARFRRTDDADEVWALDVAREGGGDWTWGKDTNGSTWAQITLALTAGQPYWERERAELVTVQPADANAGLLDPYSLAESRLASSQAFGTVTLVNPGSARSPLVIVVNGPATHLDVTGPGGEYLTWDGVLTAGQWLRLTRGIAVDQAGANRYAGLGAVPVMWDVLPGTQVATVNLTGAGTGTSVALSWQPRKWAQFG
jgi:hypothetical protein